MGILLNFDSAMELEYQVQINLIKHNLASMHFQSRQFWLFTITQGVLTMLASILAFIASSALIPEITKDILATIVGSTSGIVVFLQTMSGVCNYGTRAAMHASAAIDLRDLRDHIVLIKFKVKKEAEQGIVASHYQHSTRRGSFLTAAMTAGGNDNGDSSSDDEEDDEEAKKVKEEEEKQEQEHDNTFARIQQRYRQSLSGCKSNIPMGLSEAFHGLHSNLLVSESMDNTMYMRNIYGPKTNSKNIIHFKAFDILASEILNDSWYPLLLPNSQKVIDKSMARLNKELNKYHKYWDEKLDEARADALEDLQQDSQDLPKHLRESQMEYMV